MMLLAVAATMALGVFAQQPAKTNDQAAEQQVEQKAESNKEHKDCKKLQRCDEKRLQQLVKEKKESKPVVMAEQGSEKLTPARRK